MPVLEMDERVEERSSHRSTTGRGFLRRWWAVTDDKVDDPVVVESYFSGQTGVSIGSPYVTTKSFDLGAQCNDIRVRQDDDSSAGTNWLIEVTYETGAVNLSNPLSRPVRWSAGFAAYSKLGDRDKDGKPVLNSARHPYNPPIEIDDSRPVIRAVRNERTFNIKRMAELKDAVNVSAWKGVEPRCAKIKDIQSGELQTENGVEFYAVTYEFELNEDTFDFVVLDAGFHELILKGKKVQPKSGGRPLPRLPDQPKMNYNQEDTWKKIKDDDGYEPSEPVPLDGDGRKLDEKHWLIPDKLTWNTYRIYKEKDFSILGL